MLAQRSFTVLNQAWLFLIKCLLDPRPSKRQKRCIGKSRLQEYPRLRKYWMTAELKMKASINCRGLKHTCRQFYKWSMTVICDSRVLLLDFWQLSSIASIIALDLYFTNHLHHCPLTSHTITAHLNFQHIIYALTSAHIIFMLDNNDWSYW